MVAWNWIEVECKHGCGKVVRVPPDDPIANDGWSCAGCQYRSPRFGFEPVKPKRDGGPTMSNAPSKSKDQNPCACGCGESATGTYRQGHDSKHISKLVAEVISGDRSKSSALRQFPDSAPLKIKLKNAIERAEAKAEAAKAKAKDKADREQTARAKVTAKAKAKGGDN